ncbi:hypothetical protein Lal_00044657 [Lupinus albus]|nr:hypothetical protein Lal_00044657 [Lupinus albus]
MVHLGGVTVGRERGRKKMKIRVSRSPFHFYSSDALARARTTRLGENFAKLSPGRRFLAQARIRKYAKAPSSLGENPSSSQNLTAFPDFTLAQTTTSSLGRDLGISKKQRFLAGATPKERFSLSVDRNNSFRYLRIISTLPTQSSSYFITDVTFDVEFVIIKKGEIENLGISKEQRFLAGATPKERFSLSIICQITKGLEFEELSKDFVIKELYQHQQPKEIYKIESKVYKEEEDESQSQQFLLIIVLTLVVVFSFMLLRGKTTEDQLQFNPEIEKSAKSNRKKAKAKKKQDIDSRHSIHQDG